MSGSLGHTPAEIIQQLLVDLSLGTIGGAWAIYENDLPDSPDNAILVSDTVGTKRGRTHFDGETQLQYGITITVRATTQTIGNAKANAIATAFDSSVNRNTVVVDGMSYLVSAITLVNAAISLGLDVSNSRRRLFSVNALTSLRAA